MMNRLLTVIFMAACFSCQETQTEKQEALAEVTQVATVETNELIQPFEFQVMEEPAINTSLYTMDLKSVPLENNTYDLVIDMTLKEGGHFVSPNSTVAYTGRFTVFIEDKDHLNLIGNLIETPLSVEEIDPHPFVNGPINWVRENVTYRQQLKINTTDDFLVFGHIQFTIEPKCTLEKIPFIIKYTKGKMAFEIDKC